ncbi:MAG: mannose-1-phosphate guanylyltransferase [Candidatus Fermentibacteraceae bacterium]|nr:mannose-1-phosphate guanylyltransferase [Candidatus Fermentibacteraceae bacterium]
MGSDFFAVIMAGGRGTRFWPVSTCSRPKQFLRLAGSGTMLEETADRFLGLCGRDRIMVVTGATHEDTVMEQLPWMDRDNLLLEPVGRNTAPCIGWAAGTLIERGLGSELMIVVPSDHVIDNPEGFRETVRIAAGPAMEGKLVTIGIPPDRPATGYGYLQTGKCRPGEACRVRAFREKPDLETALRYLASGDYLWNAGMFIWKADVIMEQIRLHLPELARGLSRMGPGTRPDIGAYGSLESLSIDFGLMEKADDVVAVPALFEWNDIGDWPSARRCGVGRGEVLLYDSADTTVWNQGRLTILLGIRGISIVQTDRVTLVMSDEYSQRLKDIVDGMEDIHPELL